MAVKVPKINLEPVIDIYELKKCLVSYFGPEVLPQGEEITELLYGQPVEEGLFFKFKYHKLDEEDVDDPFNDLDPAVRRNEIRQYMRMNLPDYY